MKIITSNIVTAFLPSTIGTKVVDSKRFFDETMVALTTHNISNDIVPGQHFITLPNAHEYLSSGVGKRTKNVDDYILRLHRRQVRTYLRRKFAAPIESGAAVVYTFDAYKNDPQVDDEELKNMSDCSHVLVAVLGFSGPKIPLTPGRFVQNLAGGNNEALYYTADDIRKIAKEIVNYWSSEDGGQGWCVVAD